MNSRQSPCISDFCPVCDSTDIATIVETSDVPIHCNLLWESREQALQAPRGDIKLGFCGSCGHVFNIAFDPDLMKYSQEYENSLHFSPRFQEYARSLATRLVQYYDLYDKDIIEIGCGKGDFLILLSRLGNNRGVGIDPAVVPNRIRAEISEHVTFIKDYYSDRYSQYHGDLVCCRHTLEHIFNTGEFISSVRRSIGDRLDTIVFFEVPDVTRILCEGAFWDIYYEHCSYFSPGSLARLFRLSKFKITYLSRDFGDQYLLLEAKPVDEVSVDVHELEENTKKVKEKVELFSVNCRNKLDDWKNRLKQIDEDRLRAVIWGSGSKCVSFMTTLAVKDEIPYIIDINPYRHNKFIPGVGKKIMPPEFIKKYKPDITIVMNPIYFKEIREMIEDMEVSTEMIPVE